MKCREKMVPRQVIESQLLVALDDKSKVAIIASEDDLSLLVYALTPASESAQWIVPEDWENKRTKMIHDLQQLKQAAFGI